jgi:hypothetical protein
LHKLGVFCGLTEAVWLGIGTVSQHLRLNMPWMIVLVIGAILPLCLCGTLLWRRTRFS